MSPDRSLVCPLAAWPVKTSTPATLFSGFSLFLLSAASLAFEINLTRLFSVAQFYHFAFMIVSIALLGIGASGTFLAIFPMPPTGNTAHRLRWLSLAAGYSMLGSYLLTNWLPFDSFSIAWERRQIFILVLHYIALATPFFFTGLAIGMLLAAYPRAAGGIYAFNLFGSALGCILAVLAPNWLGGEGMVSLSSGLAGLAALFSRLPEVSPGKLAVIAYRLCVLPLLIIVSLDLGLRLSLSSTFGWMELRLSPYKALSYALQYPDAQVLYRRWNAFSRIDLVQSASFHSYPGLSYRYLAGLPSQEGLFTDGDDLSPFISPDSDLAFADYLASALAYHLRPTATALILEPRGGGDVLVALALGARRVVAVEVNPLIVAAAAPVYRQPGVQVVIDSDRSFLKRSRDHFDVIVLSLTSSYHPVRSGAYSLAEDYRYTVEAFQDAIARLSPQGILVVTRWLQTPPSECLRAFALAVTALEREQADPRQQIVALRGYNSATLLIKRSAFTPSELRQVREFAAGRAFDLVFAPDLRPDEVNQFNILPEPVYYQAFQSLLQASPRRAFYEAYPYDVTPPSDDHPFFGHYFKWAQAGAILAELGKTWQPFGGAGYFVILALFVLALVLAIGLIVLPLFFSRLPSAPGVPRHAMRWFPGLWPSLAYFGLIGFAYLLVEIPLIQRFILYLGHPAYAMAVVLFTLLLFSGLGSRFSHKVSARWAIAFLVLFLVSLLLGLPFLFAHTLGWPFPARLGSAVLLLAVPGFFMGTPFPAGIHLVTLAFSDPEYVNRRAFLIPWVWGVNGAASVVAAVLAALLALTWGYSRVLIAGALCYTLAWLLILLPAWRRSR